MSTTLRGLMPRGMIAQRMRKEAALHAIPVDRYAIRVARTVQEYEDAFTILHYVNVFQGFEPVRGKTMHITAQHVLPESTVLVAYEGAQMVGSLTVTLDSPAGLPIDQLYPAEVGALRSSGARLAEYGSVAIVRRCQGTGVQPLLTMAAHFWASKLLAATHALTAPSPDAAPYWEALYGFTPLGPPLDKGEDTRSAQGMVQDIAQAGAQLLRDYPETFQNGVPVGEAFGTLALPCFELPRELAGEDHARWKLPREVFQELFIRRSDHLHSLDARTLEYLATTRSRQTLEATDQDIDDVVAWAKQHYGKGD